MSAAPQLLPGTGLIPHLGVLDPDAVIDYQFDYLDPAVRPRPYLDATETIAVSEWVTDPGLLVGDGLTPVGGVIPEAPSIIGGTKTQAWLYADPNHSHSAGVLLTVTNRITTSQGRVDDHSFTLVVQEK